MTELEVAIASEITPTELPVGLPLAHLTACRWISSILSLGRLDPRPCKVFSESLLYFSYGGVFYRASAMQTESATELPIAFVFSPSVMKSVCRLFPFDSGALAGSRFGPEWSAKLDPFSTRFALDTSDPLWDARRLVYHLYESNSQYLDGNAASSAKLTHSPLPLLHEFLTSDLSSLEVDHRQRTIEAITEVAVALSKDLLWIGLPEVETSRILNNLYEWTQPNLTRYWGYRFTRNFNPSQIAAQLEERAYEEVIKAYAQFPNQGRC